MPPPGVPDQHLERYLRNLDALLEVVFEDQGVTPGRTAERLHAISAHLADRITAMRMLLAGPEHSDRRAAWREYLKGP